MSDDDWTGYVPTCELRYVERFMPLQFKRVLQQKWVGTYIGQPDRWRDVPTEDET